MTEKIQAVRGMHDILPAETSRWQVVEAILGKVLNAYGYREIRLPLVERTELFQRSIGEVTDIVEKEMYTFADRNGDSLTLRPEGTAGCLRACLEHGLLHNQMHRLWYLGPMFRHERPQKGRYRQFCQLGVETYGMAGPDIDAELILLNRRFWVELGLEDKLELQINSLGTTEERARYREALVAYFERYPDELDEDSRRRVKTNPLRILDSKNPDMADLIYGAPMFAEFLGEASRQHFQDLIGFLDDAGVAYVINPHLVRGLDYYCLTVFEWVTTALGAQGTVCAGGRYDGLLAQLGSTGTGAVGFAMGMERLLALMENSDGFDAGNRPHVYLIRVGAAADRAGMLMAERLRSALPELRLTVNCGGGNFKSQFKRADKSGAEFAFILGDDEAANGTVSIKPLREERGQTVLTQDQAADFLRPLLASPAR